MALVKLRDATITVGAYTVIVGEGSLNWDEKRPLEYKPLRGVFEDVSADISQADTIIAADEEPMDVSFDFIIKQYSSGTINDIQTAFKGEAVSGCGAPSAEVTVDLDSCPANQAASGDSYSYVFKDFRWETMGGDLNAGRISVSGKCQFANYRSMAATV